MEQNKDYKPCIKRNLMVLNPLEKQIMFGWSDKIAYIIDDASEVEKYFISLLNGKRTLPEIINIMSTKYPIVTENDVNNSLLQFKKANLLEEDFKTINSILSNEEKEVYDRQLLYFSFTNNLPIQCQEKLKNAKVLLLGLGGAGSTVAYNLAASGVGYIYAIDYDYVENSNLNRSLLFSMNDVGKEKTEVASKKIKEYNKNVIFKTVNMRIDFNNLTNIINNERFDILIRCIDQPKDIKSWVNKACVEKGIPYISGGYVEYNATWGPLYIPGVTACWNCGDENRSDIDSNNIKYSDSIMLEDRYNSGSMAPITGIAGNLIALDVIKLLSGFDTPTSIDKKFYFDSSDLKLFCEKLTINPNCSICGKKVKC